MYNSGNNNYYRWLMMKMINVCQYKIIEQSL